MIGKKNTWRKHENEMSQTIEAKNKALVFRTK